jgi:hypothetical protein
VLVVTALACLMLVRSQNPWQVWVVGSCVVAHVAGRGMSLVVRMLVRVVNTASQRDVWQLASLVAGAPGSLICGLEFLQACGRRQGLGMKVAQVLLVSGGGSLVGHAGEHGLLRIPVVCMVVMLGSTLVI